MENSSDNQPERSDSGKVEERNRVRPGRVLILSVRHGAAHERVARALEKALNELRPDLEVKVIDTLEHCARWFRAYYNSYEIPLKYWPALWGWIERFQHEGSATGPAWLFRQGARPLFQFIRAFGPDIVIATETGACELAAMLKRENGRRFFLVGVDGLDVDRAWAQPEVDLFPASGDGIAARLQDAGVPPHKIVSCGMPLDPAFARLPDRAEVRRRLELPLDFPLVLVLFGGAGFGKPREIVSELGKIQRPFRAILFTGKNKHLEIRLKALCAGKPHCQVLGWVNNLHEWMVAADLVVNKPSGLALVEAMTCGLPFLALDPLPGNEHRHCDLIEKWGVGIWVKRHADLASTIERLLSEHEELAQFRKNALARARPRAAYDAARAILELAPPS